MDRGSVSRAESPHSFNMSSSGAGSPEKLKSVNEMEKRLDCLEKENFNLRMKLFYQQESWANSKSDRDMAKEIVELKVQIANNHETIKEKTEAVVKASKALNFMEALLGKNEKELTGLKNRIAELEGCMSSNTVLTTTRKSIDCSEGTNLNDSSRIDPVAENPMLLTLEKENECLKGEVQRLQDCVKDMVNQMDELMMKDDDSKNKTMNSSSSANQSKLEECLEQLKGENKELKEELCQAKKDIQNTAKNLEVAKSQLLDTKRKTADLMCENEELAEKLKKSEVGLRNATKIVEKMMSTSNNNQSTNSYKLSPFEDESYLNAGAGGDANADPLACEMRRIIKEKNADICEIKSQLMKAGKTTQCIDKELEGKRSELQRLIRALATHEEKRDSNANCNPPPPTQQLSTTNSWGSARTAKTCDMTTLSNMSSGLNGQGGGVAATASTMDHYNEMMVKRMEEELAESENKSQQMTEVATVLRLRLEELAGFLKTLLQHKDILGFLCRERVTAIEKAVDRSLNLTNSMDLSCGNMTLGDITNVSKLFGDFSLNVMDQTKASDNVVECPLDESTPAAMIVSASASTVDALRKEILTLRSELERAYKKKECDSRKDNNNKVERKSLPCHRAENNNINNCSDSEWSGPDLNVSAQRIGIEVAKDRAILISSSDEEQRKNVGMDLSCGSSSSVKRGMMEKMLKYEREIECRDNKVLEVKLAMVELEAVLKQEQMHAQETMRNLTQCKEMNVALDRQVGELKGKLSEALVEVEGVKCRLQKEQEKGEKETVVMLAMEKKEGEKRLEEMRKKLQTEIDCKAKEVEQQKTVSEQRLKEVVEIKAKLQEAQKELERMREKEKEWCADVMGAEERTKKLKKTLDELTIQATRAAVERTKAVNERDRALVEKKEVEAKYDCLLEERIKMKDRLYESDKRNKELLMGGGKGQEGGMKECDATSGYGSEETRPSSPEQKRDAVVVKLTAVAGGSGGATGGGKAHDCDQVDSENQELKRRLAHLKRTLEHTFNKLKMSNQMKEKVERDIQQQLIKTNNVLKMARGNIENRQS